MYLAGGDDTKTNMNRKAAAHAKRRQDVPAEPAPASRLRAHPRECNPSDKLLTVTLSSTPQPRGNQSNQTTVASGVSQPTRLPPGD